MLQVVLSTDTSVTICWYKCYCLLIQLVLSADTSGTVCWYKRYCLLIQTVLSAATNGTVCWYKRYCLLIQAVLSADTPGDVHGRYCSGAARVRSEICLQKISRKIDMCNWPSARQERLSCSRTENRSFQSPSLTSGLSTILDLYAAISVQDILLVTALWMHRQVQHYPVHILAVIV